VVAPAFGWNCIAACDCSLYNADPTQDFCVGDHCSQMMTPFTTELILVGGVCLLVLLVLSVLVYFHIFVKVRYHSSSSGSEGGTGLKQTNLLRKAEMKMMRTMLIVLFGFILTTGPLAVCCVISYAYNRRQLHFVMRGLVVMSTLNSILNPLFYFWRIPEMSRKLRKMRLEFSGCCCPAAPEEHPPLGRQRRASSFHVFLGWISGSSKRRSSNLNGLAEADSIAARQLSYRMGGLESTDDNL